MVVYRVVIRFDVAFLHEGKKLERMKRVRPPLHNLIIDYESSLVKRLFFVVFAGEGDNICL